MWNLFFFNSHVEVAPSYQGNKERVKQTTGIMRKQKVALIAQRNSLKNVSPDCSSGFSTKAAIPVSTRT